MLGIFKQNGDLEMLLTTFEILNVYMTSEIKYYTGDLCFGEDLVSTILRINYIKLQKCLSDQHKF